MRQFLLVLLLICAVPTLSSPISNKNTETNSSAVFTRYLEAPNNIRDVRCLLYKGDTLVPVIGLQKSRRLFVSKRRGLFAAGVYPGVEYKLLNITVLNPSSSSATATTTSSVKNEVITLQGLLGREFRDKAIITTDFTTATSGTAPATGQFFDRVYSAVGINVNDNVISEEDESMVELTVAPAYPLIKGLEREWPVRIALSGTQPHILLLLHFLVVATALPFNCREP